MIWILPVLLHLALAKRISIGIMTQPLSPFSRKLVTGEKMQHYIQKSYVTYLELHPEVEVVPLFCDEEKSTLLEKVGRLSGVVMPGGSGDYTSNGQLVFQELMRLKQTGVSIPLWGICLGYQNIIQFVAPKVLEDVVVVNSSHPIQYSMPPEQTRFFSSLSSEQQYQLTSLPMTYHYHHWALTEQAYYRHPELTSFFQLTSLSTADWVTKYVNSMEARNFPFYVTLWHPEKQFTVFPYHLDVDRSERVKSISKNLLYNFLSQCNHDKPFNASELIQNNQVNLQTFFNTTIGDVYLYK